MPNSETPHPHFLIVILSGAGQLIPARRLARRIVRLTGAHVTIATPLSSHRRLFPTSTTAAGEPEDLNPNTSGIISYAPYSDGFDQGFDPKTDPGDRYMSELKSTGRRSLSALAHSLESRRRRVTCVIYSILLTWAADIARDLSVPAVLYWIQPASLFALYYHYFRDRRQSDFPGLPPLRSEELPSILTSASPFRSGVKEIFLELERQGKEQRRVLVNTFGELEAAAMDGISTVELIAMGPMVGEEEECSGGYMEWLEEQRKGSVVYVAFGSIMLPAARQVEEIEMGLEEGGRPYLWVQRKGGGSRAPAGREGNGIVVEWCEQGRVLSHRAVGCFVTHCGWNSMTEAVMGGVPMVMMPEWMDQTTNAALAERMWGIGVRPEAGEDGVVEAVELRRCIELVMGEGEKGREIRKRAEEWKEKAAEAIGDDGPSTRNLKLFLEGL